MAGEALRSAECKLLYLGRDHVVRRRHQRRASEGETSRYRFHLICREIDPLRLDDAGWIQLLYFRSNTRGVHAERWCHQHGCGRFFNALRDTVSDQFLTSYAIGTTPAVAPHSGEAQ